MERLTFDGNFCDIAQCTSTPGGSFCEDGSCSARKVWERLKAYEDTGLEPEEIDMDHEAAEQLRQLCRDYDLDRLEKLAEADRAGRLVVPPCKAGDTVYEVTSRKTISEYRVKAIRVELFCTFIEWDIVAGFVDKSIFGVPVNEIGKTVFLTREEADRALEGKRNA
jgi:hypothetical protein